MAKIAKPKKREVSVHSRAHRRNATPPAEIAKPGTSAAAETDHWMYNAQNAGVHKKSKSKKGPTRQQHMRHAKAMEKADRNSAVLETKVSKSKLRGKKIQARAKDWDELNGEIVVTVDGPITVIRRAKDVSAGMEGIEEQPPPAIETSTAEQNHTDISTQLSAIDSLAQETQGPQVEDPVVEELGVIT